MNYSLENIKKITIFAQKLLFLKEEKKILQRLHKKVGKAMKKYGLIKDGDKVLIGLSGGKDSLALVEFMAERMKIFHPKFSVVAAHVSMENIPYKSDIAYLKDFCESRGVPFYHLTTSFDLSSDYRKSPCFLCSWNRRKQLFNLAEKLSCTKIALGHHQDDILQTLLMNLSFQGAFSTMPPLLKMKKMEFDIIRPMCLLTESEVQIMADMKDYHKQIKNCPHEEETHREEMKAVMQMLEKMNPQVKGSLWGAMNNIQEEYLPQEID